MNKIIRYKVLLCLFFIVGTSSFTIVKAESNDEKTGSSANFNEASTITQGLRWPHSEDEKNWITIKMSDGGVRIVDQNNLTEFLAIDSYGGIYLNGDVYVKGQTLKSYIQGDAEESQQYEKDNVILTFVSLIFIFLSIIILLIYKYKKNLDRLDKKIEYIKNSK